MLSLQQVQTLPSCCTARNNLRQRQRLSWKRLGAGVAEIFHVETLRRIYPWGSGARPLSSSAQNSKPLKELLVVSGPPYGLWLWDSTWLSGQSYKNVNAIFSVNSWSILYMHPMYFDHTYPPPTVFHLTPPSPTSLAPSYDISSLHNPPRPVCVAPIFMV